MAIDKLNINSTEIAESAINFFYEGYNCSQSLALAFKNFVNIPEKEFIKMVTPLGGGISRLRETCGVISVSALILGFIFGYDTPETGNKKAELYSLTQDVIKTFVDKYKTIICRELLNLSPGFDTPIPTPRNKEFYVSRPCKNFIYDMSFILAEYIKTH